MKKLFDVGFHRIEKKVVTIEPTTQLRNSTVELGVIFNQNYNNKILFLYYIRTYDTVLNLKLVFVA